MAYTGKLGTGDSRPGEIILGGDAPAGGGGGVIDRSLSNFIDLVQEAVSSIKSVFGASVIILTGEATSEVPQIHVTASSTLAMTVAATSSIRMLSASSPITLTQSALSATFDVSAVSTLALVSTAGATTFDLTATSAIALTDSASPGLYKRSLTDTLAVTQDAVCVGGTRSFSASSPLSMTTTASAPQIRYKSASSPISLVSSALGEGPISAAAVNDDLVLTDSARSGIWMVSASNIVVLNDTAYKGQTYEVAASSPVSLTDTAVGFNLHVYATSPISLVSFVENTEKYRDGESVISLTSTASAEQVRAASNTLALTQLAVCNNIGKQTSSELTLTDEARNTNIRILAEASVIEFTQEVTSNIKMLSIEDIIPITDSLNVLRPHYATANSALTTVTSVFDLDTFSFIEVVTGLTQSVSYQLIGLKTASNIISFAQNANGSHVRADGIDCEAESTLVLADQAWNSKTAAANNTLSLLASTASAQLSNALAESELDSLNVQADFLITRNQSASNALEVKQSVAFILERDNTRCTYSPFVGGTSDPDAPTPPPVTYPAAGVTPGFRLQYPSTGMVTDELTLRTPNLGNQDRLAMTKINRETRGGTLIVYADPIWPKVETLLVSFSGLSNTQAQGLLTFMDDYLGQEIRLIDWEDRVWVGVITNPSDPIVQDGPGCQMAASFEFEGTKV
jgi:hypothetical protein